MRSLRTHDVNNTHNAKWTDSLIGWAINQNIFHRRHLASSYFLHLNNRKRE